MARRKKQEILKERFNVIRDHVDSLDDEIKMDLWQMIYDREETHLECSGLKYSDDIPLIDRLCIYQDCCEQFGIKVDRYFKIVKNKKSI